MSDFIRPSELEIATAAVVGRHRAEESHPSVPESPLQVLERVIRPSLLDPPCRVAFSGGRDSSAVLAVATRLAIREGHEPPVPVTRVYPQAPRTDESRWQRRVIDHLGLDEWVRLTFTDEHEFLGEAARGSLRRRGLLWPPALHNHGTWYDRLGPGPLLTGEGGDDVLGQRRVAPLAALLERRRPPRALVAFALRSVAPRPVRRRLVLQQAADTPRPWLRPHVRQWLLDAIVEDAVSEPLRYDRATRRISRRRSWRVYTHNHARVAAEHGVVVVDPLLDPRFVHALADAGGRLGYPGRTATMRALFRGLLPDELLTRRTKAVFNEAYMGASVHEFARAWDGTGVNTELVDADALRTEWLSDDPAPGTALLLQRAWLHGEGAVAEVA